jgi:squalene-associated FAD-dependent desaturase
MAGLENLDFRLPPVMPRIAIIGAGWAGLAAAVDLAPLARISLFEAGRTPGGRARCMHTAQGDLDNGQHILLGAYQTCLRLMRQVGVDPDQALLRQPLSWHQADGLSMQCPRLPAPFHLLFGLLGARGLCWRDKWRLALALGRLSASGWRIDGDMPVLEWLSSQQQGRALQAVFWRPLVLSALNTPLESASMRILAAVMRDSLGSARSASDLLLPRQDLSSLFPDPAWTWLAGQGADLHLAHRVASVRQSGDGVLVDGEYFDAAIVACAPYHAEALLGEENLSQAVKTLHFLPIYTVYLRFEHAPHLPRSMTGLQQGCAHWLFDRDALCDDAGLVSAVISAPAPESLPDNAQLVSRVLADVRTLVPDLPDPLWSRVLADKRATFAAEAGLVRPDMCAARAPVYLAGDWIESDYPATLEGAVRSGVAAADALVRRLKLKKRESS